VLDELSRRALCDDPSGPDESDALADRFGLFDAVRRQQNRRAVLVVEGSQVAPELVAELEIDARGRFVKDEQRRVERGEYGGRSWSPLASAGPGDK
jgi:hypothetical protein